ncbi:hypothetical protein [Vreelandella nanhaiensis]|uniref:hypothetical protein n=1 Tax=Vreelandella nanhaiensis TaxID=1258546 RepID=UPI00163C166C|nr:hypothetical protein [Halomonas nanhaiensis]
MDPAPANPDLLPVLEEFGGEPGLASLMDDLMEIMLKNPPLRPFFIDTKLDRVKRQLVE